MAAAVIRTTAKPRPRRRRPAQPESSTTQLRQLCPSCGEHPGCASTEQVRAITAIARQMLAKPGKSFMPRTFSGGRWPQRPKKIAGARAPPAPKLVFRMPTAMPEDSGKISTTLPTSPSHKAFRSSSALKASAQAGSLPSPANAHQQRHKRRTRLTSGP